MLSSSALLPSVRKLPFLVVALVALAILLLALGALPVSLAPRPAAELLIAARLEVALGGLLVLGASVVAYLLA